MKIQRLHCTVCKRDTKAISQGTSHGLHAFMSFITMGLWLLIWALVTSSNNAGWQCDVCGADMSRAHKSKKFAKTWQDLKFFGAIGIFVILFFAFSSIDPL